MRDYFMDLAAHMRDAEHGARTPNTLPKEDAQWLTITRPSRSSRRGSAEDVKPGTRFTQPHNVAGAQFAGP